MTLQMAYRNSFLKPCNKTARGRNDYLLKNTHHSHNYHMKIRIGTRASRLALTQTQMVIDALGGGYEIEVVQITTTGDKIQDKPLYDIGGKALFLKEIEEALLECKIDIAVHSMKDVPGKLPHGLKIAAVLEREDPRDLLISSKATKIANLPHSAKIGTCAVRRIAQVHHIRPDLEIHEMRGNVNTRLDKWRDGDLDGIIVALAGVKRLGLYDSAYCHIISEEEMLPAVGQGIIAIEIRNGDTRMEEACQKINHLPTWQLLEAERGFLEYLDADCRTPLAALAKFDGDKIEARYMLKNDFGYHQMTESMIEKDAGYEAGVMVAKSIER